MTESRSLIPIERIEQAILLIRGHKVMLDRDLADLYRVETKTLNQAVKRNLDRFPEDFMFQLSWEEAEIFKVTNCDPERGGRRIIKVTTCDLEARPESQVPPLCLHRAGGGHAL